MCSLLCFLQLFVQEWISALNANIEYIERVLEDKKSSSNAASLAAAAKNTIQNKNKQREIKLNLQVNDDFLRRSLVSSRVRTWRSATNLTGVQAE